MSQQDQGRMMHIGEVAERTGLSLRTIRHYDEVKLLPPSGRTEGGFRLYTESDVERLVHIRRIAPLGFTLEETTDILRILNDEESVTEPNEYLTRAQEAREKLARKLRQADELIADLNARSHSHTSAANRS
ncbi:MerR family transcriptional regulator [Brachybacterium paraconglomeratum]|uniref:MerR family transcriptional regulator n=1 Tax=Brachybacterium paraconglomeratum TaxID=173362 RepID=UPI00223B979F|nr:MerR family transcriptional regulator [Brachybacterium paraconglomeratum]MCT1437683.1 MerR family transcriptional regulator [Brachybacterium paraconglomeratum]